MDNRHTAPNRRSAGPQLGPFHGPKGSAPDPVTAPKFDPCAPHLYLRPMSSEAVSAAASPAALQAELQQFDADYIAAFDAGNAQALVALFTEDPVVMNTFGTIVSGRSAIMAALEHSFAGPCQGATLKITPSHSKRVSDNVVVQQGTTQTTLKTDTPTCRDFNYTKVFVRQGTTWKLAAAQFANVEPPRATSS